MSADHRARSCWMLAPIFAAAIAGAAGCDPAEPLRNDGETVAEVPLGNGVKLEIVAMEDGSFIATQSGPKGTQPRPIPKAIEESGDPVALFRHFAPTREVPGPMLKAVARLRPLGGAAPSDGTGSEKESPARSGGAAPVKPDPAGQQDFLYDENQSNWTGADGCPVAFFDARWCVPTTSDDVPPSHPCYHNYEWAFYERDKAVSGWGAICANDGQLTFRITRQGVVEYQVDQGSWRTAVISKKGNCGLFSCEWERAYTRFEMVNRPTDWNSGHFASDIHL
jgi:hypothetical protein